MLLSETYHVEVAVGVGTDTQGRPEGPPEFEVLFLEPYEEVVR